MTVVCTGSGSLRGRPSAGGLAFLGVPFARASRWAAPEPVAPWAGERDATRPGPACPQPDRAVATFTHGVRPPTDEQCLFLNVFTPGLEGRRPVLVWIHGGGFTIGHGAAGLYAGDHLAAAADTVVVTLNYRLGSLGWLAHPELAATPGAPAANWGLQDQIAALRWVRENVAVFGGDPDRVTLAGQSAGALSAMDLLVAPDADGLFARAILQSPPLGDVATDPAVAVRWAHALSAAAGTGEVFDPGRLRAATAEEIVAWHEALLEEPAWRGTRGGALPTLDPATLPRSPDQDPGARPDVDVLIGHAAQEGTFFFASPWRPEPPPERIPAIVGHLCHTDRPLEVLAAYRERAGGEAGDHALLVDIATDAMVARPCARWAQARAQAVGDRSRVYRYRIDHPGAGPVLRATHTVEVPLLFGTWGDGDAGQRLAGQADGAEPVAAELASAWTRFIHDGDPGWPALAEAEAEAEAGQAALGVFGAATGT